ncbi:hypothetical protein CEXT_793731 [Caerostris extrusa]|uniref:Uncharacterized protein n=1 Tax=Caerostris extrusa TaxID=172846 RepID=A0AAV4XR83_CAEEX|nr:hypothetical protein CEXT_793731 [Caerostris extrusa]
METAEDEWWRRMECEATSDYTVRTSAPGASNPELMDTTTLTGYSTDDDDLKEINILHDDLQRAMREVSKLELCPLSSCTKHKIINFNSQIKRNDAHHEHDNDGFTMPSKRLIAKVTYAKILNI